MDQVHHINEILVGLCARAGVFDHIRDIPNGGIPFGSQLFQVILFRCSVDSNYVIDVELEPLNLALFQ